MHALTFEAPTQVDAAPLFEFEKQNREFFELRINSRPDSYYSLQSVMAAIELAANDAQNDISYQFIIKDLKQQVVGRVNLTEVKRRHFYSAKLGYRIAESENGKGYASHAVQWVIKKAFNELGLIRLEATTRPENVASLCVLQRNGFTQYGRSVKSFQLNGIWYDKLHLEIRNET